MSRRAVVLFVALMVTGSRDALVTGQGRPVRASDQQGYSAATTAILVDVVVRDRKGHPVTDLETADFSLFEDGTPQKIDTFTRITRGGGIGVGVRWKSPSSTLLVTPHAAALPAATEDKATDDATTALVFDHLGEDALRMAQRATLDYIPMSGDSGVRVGVFVTDPRMKLLQPYTIDRSAIRSAVQKVMPSGTSAADLTAERRDQLTDRRRELMGQTQAIAAGANTGAGGTTAAGGGATGQAEAELQLINLERSMIDSFDALDRDHKGYDTSLTLMAVIQTLSVTPGRKSVVFFSEGLPASPALSAKLDDVIDAANRANVTVYAVDASGLRAKSTFTETRKEMQEFVDDRLLQTGSGSTRTDQPLTRAFEKVEDAVRLDSRTGLARLSQDTGGFLFEQSNNLSAAFERIDEDNQFHYLLSYTPSNTAFDGRFRNIQVTAHRSGVQVFSRRGYRAVRVPFARDSEGYEIPALAILNHAPLPNAFPMQAQGFAFPDPKHPGITPIVVRLATDSLRYSTDSDRSTYSAQVAVLVRVRDAQGHDVQRLSQQYSLSGDLKDLEAAKKGTIIFYREPQLAPGVYTLESIALDVISGQASVRVSTLSVPTAEATALGMSSLVFVDHLEQIGATPAEHTQRAAPFFMHQTLVYPNVGDPIARSTTNSLPFFFTVYRSTNEPVTATAELMSNGRVMAEAPIEIAMSDSPLLQEIGRLPVGALASGTYELRIRVAAAGQSVTRSAFFTLQE